MTDSPSPASGPLSGQVALVTGASGGIGADIARELAAKKTDLIVTARSEGPLRTLAEALQARHGIRVHVFTADLATTAGTEDLLALVDSAGLEVDLLVNNAGLGAWRPFAEQPWPEIATLIDLNITALTRLTAHFLPGMLARRRGRIMNIASFVAFVSCPNFAVYGAAKAYVRNLTEALDRELRGTGVRALAVCPGGTRTGFSAAAGQKLNAMGERSLMTSEAVARLSVRKLLRGRRTYIPGFMNAFMGWLFRFIPRAWQPGLMKRIMDAGVQKGPRLDPPR